MTAINFQYVIRSYFAHLYNRYIHYFPVAFNTGNQPIHLAAYELADKKHHCIIINNVHVWGILYKHTEKNQPRWEKFQESMSIFRERCNAAEEKIYQTVDNVEGILFLKMRSDSSNRQKATKDRHWPDAALPDDLVEGNSYMGSLVSDKNSTFESSRRAFFLNAKPATSNIEIPRLYDYVDVYKKTSIMRFSYADAPFYSVRRDNDPVNPARYAVSYRNIVNPTDREHWISGLTVSIIDTKENAVIAEKTWYTFNYQKIIDSIHPSNVNYKLRGSVRDSVLSCSSSKNANAEYLYGATRVFITSVLKPRNTETNNKRKHISSFLPPPPPFRSLLSEKMTFSMEVPIIAYLILLFMLHVHILLSSFKWWKKCLACIVALLVFIGPFYSVYPVNSLIQQML